MNLKRKRLLTLLVLTICTICLAVLAIIGNTGEEEIIGGSNQSTYEKAVVVSILEENVEQVEKYEGKYVGKQELLIHINTGQFKGLDLSAPNYLGALYGTRLDVGDKLVVGIYVENGEIKDIGVYDYDKSIPLLIIIGIFIAVTVLIGGRKGVRSIIGLAATIVAMLFILLPLLMKGAPTILTSFIICILMAVFSYTVLDGISKKTILAICGTTIGLLLAVLFGLIAQKMVRIDGMRMGDYVDALLQLKMGGSKLRLSGMLIGGMVISALGAVMDVAMSISSAMSELVAINGNLSRKQLIKSGMNIGRDMIGTMTNTLILAFVGSSFLLVIYIYTLGVPVYELLSSNLVATEIIHGIASSMGVVVSVPATVLIGSFIFKHD